jgi:hypothetical protein
VTREFRDFLEDMLEHATGLVVTPSVYWARAEAVRQKQLPVAPAKAGAQSRRTSLKLGPRLRGDDRKKD